MPSKVVDIAARAVTAAQVNGNASPEMIVEAVILAMREIITKEMAIAGEAALEEFTDSDYDSGTDGHHMPYSIRRPGWELHVWQAMMDKALE